MGEWRDDARCVDDGRLTNVFFPAGEPQSGEGSEHVQAMEAQAKAICATCPSREPCLEFALRTNQPYGVWGGLNNREIQRVRAVRRRGRRAG